MGLSLADIFYTLIESGIGKSLDDLRFNYTIDQVYLMYQKARKNQLENWRMDTIVLVEALSATSPKYDKSAAQKASKQLKKFLDSLTFDKTPSEKNKFKTSQMKSLSNELIPTKIIKHI